MRLSPLWVKCPDVCTSRDLFARGKLPDVCFYVLRTKLLVLKFQLTDPL
jgi:hypothetical protein